jgi:hypothetical protein
MFVNYIGSVVRENIEQLCTVLSNNREALKNLEGGKELLENIVLTIGRAAGVNLGELAGAENETGYTARGYHWADKSFYDYADTCLHSAQRAYGDHWESKVVEFGGEAGMWKRMSAEHERWAELDGLELCERAKLVTLEDLRKPYLRDAMMVGWNIMLTDEQLAKYKDTLKVDDGVDLMAKESTYRSIAERQWHECG